MLFCPPVSHEIQANIIEALSAAVQFRQRYLSFLRSHLTIYMLINGMAGETTAVHNTVVNHVQLFSTATKPLYKYS